MPYAEGRVFYDADSHLMELPDFLREHADPGLRERMPPLSFSSGGKLGDALERLGKTKQHPAERVAELVGMGDGLISGPKGYEALEQRVASSHEKNVRGNGFRFIATGDAQLLRDTVMFRWQMVPAAGGPVAALGLEFLLLAEDGRIAIDYQFILPTPAA